MVTTSDIRARFLEFFENRGHRIVASSPLVPGNDKTLLFTNAGMVQFKDVFTGAEKRSYTRATTSQRCVRAGGKHNDLDNVGYTARHHTFFEMLGNFSFGDYFKEEAIGYAWEFLTEVLALPADKLWVTVFEEDDEAERLWVDKIGVPAERVIRIGAKDNFWMMGDTGPCGPCSEIFYDHGPEIWGGPPGTPEEDGDRFIEIWNLVFMQYDRSADGTMTPLPSPCVDTGMGLERIAAVLQHVHSNYEIDLFQGLISASADAVEAARADVAAASRIAQDPIDRDSPSLKVIADHIRSCAFLITDGVFPGNEGRAYVLRRIIRRAARHGHKLGATQPFFHTLVDALVTQMGAAYPELAKASNDVVEQLRLEEERFAVTLSTGLKILDEEVATLEGTQIPGEVVFRLYDTYGFPVDLTADIARERQLQVDTDGFEVHMQAQRERARAASGFSLGAVSALKTDADTQFLGYEELAANARIVGLFVDGQPVQQVSAGHTADVILDQTPFYGESGGQVGDTGSLSTEEGHFDVIDTQKQNKAFIHRGTQVQGTLNVGDTVHARIDELRRRRIRQHHSATHLLHGALRHVLGQHVEQRGSLVNDSQLRFDFSHSGPISPEHIAQIEQWVDGEIRLNHTADTREMSMEDAVATGAMALFGEKYGDVVRVVRLGDQSVELCGGTHVDATGELGAFRILQESGVASGVRRIEAVSAEAATQVIQQEARQLAAIASSLKCPANEVLDKLAALQARQRELSREVEQLTARLSSQAGSALREQARTIAGIEVLMHKADNTDAKTLRTLMDSLKQQLPEGIVVLAGSRAGKASLLTWVASTHQARIKAGDVMTALASAMGGRGGGKAELAQGGAPSLDALDAGFAAARTCIETAIAEDG